VFVSEEAVLGVIEVKSSIDRGEFRGALSKLADIGEGFSTRTKLPILGLFSYDKRANPDSWFREEIPEICNSFKRRIDLINVGCSHFVKWWDFDPSQPNAEHATDSVYSKWHSYKLINMSAGYFLANVIDLVSEGLVSKSSSIWFPREGKEGIPGKQIIEPNF
jgi:hypothetical protein